MDFSDPPRRERRESIVPMINVVFLLLIFFLMTATVAPPDPVDVTPPTAEAAQDEGEAEAVLYLDAQGEAHFGGRAGDAAFAALAGRAQDIGSLTLRADADTRGTEVARLLRRLAALGVTDVALVVAQP